MAKFLRKYVSKQAFENDYNGDAYLEPWVSYTKESDVTEQVDYNKHALEIPIRIYRFSDSSLIMTKKTSGSVLTITPEDIMQFLGGDDSKVTYLDTDSSAMAAYLNMATWTPAEAKGEVLGPGMTVTIDFGAQWLEYAKDDQYGAYTTLRVDPFTPGV